MIHEIITQHVAPDKRDEYIQVFGEFLTKANYAGSHRIKGGVQLDYIKNDVTNGQQNYLVNTFWNAVCDFCSTRHCACASA